MQFLKRAGTTILGITVTGAPLVASAAARTFSELANQIVILIDSAVIVLVVFAIVTYFSKIVWSTHEAQTKGGKNLRLYAGWGIAILFIMVSVWGIIQILQNSLFGGGGAGGGGGFFDSGGTGGSSGTFF